MTIYSIPGTGVHPQMCFVACLGIWSHVQCCHVCTLPMVLRLFTSYCFDVCMFNACRHARCLCSVRLLLLRVCSLVVLDSTHACSFTNDCMLLATYCLQNQTQTTDVDENQRCPTYYYTHTLVVCLPGQVIPAPNDVEAYPIKR